MIKVYYEYKLEEVLEPHVKKQKADALKKKKEIRELEKKMGLSQEEIEKKEAARKLKEEAELKKRQKQIEKERKAREKEEAKATLARLGVEKDSDDSDYDSDAKEKEDSATDDPLEQSQPVISKENGRSGSLKKAKPVKERKNTVWLPGMGNKPGDKSVKKDESKKAMAIPSKPKDLYHLPRADVNRSATKRGPTRLDLLKAESDAKFVKDEEAKLNKDRDNLLNIMEQVARYGMSGNPEKI